MALPLYPRVVQQYSDSSAVLASVHDHFSAQTAVRVHASRMGSGRYTALAVLPYPCAMWPRRAANHGPCVPAARAAAARERGMHQPCGSLLPWPRRALGNRGENDTRTLRPPTEKVGYGQPVTRVLVTEVPMKLDYYDTVPLDMIRLRDAPLPSCLSRCIFS